MNAIENPMVLDRLWKHYEQEPNVIGECEGCKEDIYEGDDIYELDDTIVHQDPECCVQYVANISICKVAGQ